MATPQNLLDGLTKLQADSDDLLAKQADQATKAQAVVDAQHASDLAVTATQASLGTLQGDRAAFIQLVTSTFPLPTDPPAQPPPSK